MTEKGKAFNEFTKIVDDNDFSENEQWIIVYLFLLNSYFNLQPNYIFKRSVEIVEKIKEFGFSIEFILNTFLTLLQQNRLTKEKLFQLDAFWLVSFFTDNDFMNLYQKATEEEKYQLYQHVIKRSTKSKETIRKINDLVGVKFISGGQYTVTMFIDDIKTLFITFKLTQKIISNTSDLVNAVIDSYCEFATINKDKIKDFVNLHNDIFNMIFVDVFHGGNIENDLAVETEELDTIISEQPEQVVDDTTSNNSNQLRLTRAILKRITKEKANYKCELESINACKYFTAKKSEKNYLEIHHLIPFEFNNDFEESLDKVENYIALCPHCHKLLHLGVDRERKGVLNYLFNQREEALKGKNLDIEKDVLFAYYNIEE